MKCDKLINGSNTHFHLIYYIYIYIHLLYVIVCTTKNVSPQIFVAHFIIIISIPISLLRYLGLIVFFPAIRL